jgi:hypothetical protein
MEKVPKDLLGRPQLYQAWAFLSAYPHITPSELGRACGRRASDGSRINRGLAQLDLTMRNCVIVPDGLPVGKPGPILVYNAMLDMSSRHGLPFQVKLKELASAAGTHRTSTSRFIKILRQLDIIAYANMNREGISVEWVRGVQ